MRRRENQPAEEVAVSNKIDNGAAAPARRTPGPVRRERGPFLSDTISLVRALGPIDATMIVIGSMIGSGIFIVSAREDMPHVGYPIVPIISSVLSALLTIDLAWLAPATSGIAILIVLTGVPAYFLWRLRGARHASPV
jgi:hypothetical protein